jgi:hypothetical protein
MKRNSISNLVCLLLASTISAMAIPQSFINGVGNGPVIPATPRFNRDLTANFLDAKQWTQNQLDGPWQEVSMRAGREVAQMTANPTLFGSVPGSVRLFREAGKLDEIIITYLDAGKYFGFDYDGEKTALEKAAGEKRRGEFQQMYKRIADDLRSRLSKGCGSAQQNAVGRTAELRTAFEEYRTDGFVLRLALRENHSVALHIQRDNHVSKSLVDPTMEKMSAKERKSSLLKNVQTNQRGDQIIGGLPTLQQGYTPFCGVLSLAMLAQYHGLRVEPEALVAGAEFKNTGNAKGSDIPGLYKAVAEELGLKLQIGKSLNRETIERLISEGQPVVVWRRVTKERDLAHSTNTQKVLDDPTAQLPPLREEQRSYPNKSDRNIPSHASVICGYNRAKGEVIFSEPWGDAARERHMRIEEMEATVYQTFIFRL